MIAVLLPARHALLPFWPEPVVEVVFIDESGEIRVRLFEPITSRQSGYVRLRPDSGSDDKDSGDIGRSESNSIVEIAEARIDRITRPYSAAVIRMSDGSRLFAFPAGVRATDFAETSQPELEAIGLSGSRQPVRSEDPERELVVYLPGGERQEISGGDWTYLYQPNRMDWVERFGMFAYEFMARSRAADMLQEPGDSVSEGNDLID